MLNVNCSHIQTFDADLYRQLICYPQVRPSAVQDAFYHLMQFLHLCCLLLTCQCHSSLQEVIPTFDMAVNELFFDRFPDSVLEHQIQVRPYSALKTRNMRALNPEGE